MFEFTAHIVSAEFDENDVLVIAFGELIDDEPRYYFMIQGMMEEDEQDRALGLDTYYIMREDPNTDYLGTYGGIHQIELSATRLDVTLDKVGKKALGVSQIKIDYAIEEKAYARLPEKMKLIFGSTDCFKTT